MNDYDPWHTGLSSPFTNKMLSLVSGRPSPSHVRGIEILEESIHTSFNGQKEIYCFPQKFETSSILSQYKKSMIILKDF